MKRHCHIVNGSVELANGAGDGAYDLFDQEGTPEEIGTLIAESLAGCDMQSAGSNVLESGEDLYLKLCIRIRQSGKILATRTSDGQHLEVWKYDENDYSYWVGEDSTDPSDGTGGRGTAEETLLTVCEILSSQNSA